MWHDSTRELDAVIDMVIRHYDVSPLGVYSPSRMQTLSRVRFVAMYCCALATEASLEEIAHALKRKDHTTVAHGIRQVEARCMKSESFRRDVSMLLERCRTAARLARELAA